MSAIIFGRQTRVRSYWSRIVWRAWARIDRTDGRVLYRNSLDIEEWHKETVLAVEDFPNRRRVGSDDRTSNAHRLQQRPRQHKRVSQVNVSRRYLKGAEIVRVRQAAGEVNSFRVDPIGDFIEKLCFPCRSGRGCRAVGDAIAADHHDQCAPFRHNARKCAHECMYDSL